MKWLDEAAGSLKVGVGIILAGIGNAAADIYDWIPDDPAKLMFIITALFTVTMTYRHMRAIGREERLEKLERRERLAKIKYYEHAIHTDDRLATSEALLGTKE